MASGIILGEAGNCAGLMKTSKEERGERGSKVSHEAAPMSSEEWLAAVQPILLSHLPQGTLKIQRKLLPARRSHLPW